MQKRRKELLRGRFVLFLSGIPHIDRAVDVALAVALRVFADDVRHFIPAHTEIYLIRPFQRIGERFGTGADAFAPITMNKINSQLVLWGCYTLSTFSPPSVHLCYACDEAATYYPSRKSNIFIRGPRIYPTENTFGGGLAFHVLRTHTCSPHFV